jgi:hypothetical protein
MLKNEMGKACSMYKGEEMCVQGLMGKPERRRPLGICSIDGMIISKWMWLRRRRNGGIL